MVFNSETLDYYGGCPEFYTALEADFSGETDLDTLLEFFDDIIGDPDHPSTFRTTWPSDTGWDEEVTRLENYRVNPQALALFEDSIVWQDEYKVEEDIYTLTELEAYIESEAVISDPFDFFNVSEYTSLDEEYTLVKAYDPETTNEDCQHWVVNDPMGGKHNPDCKEALADCLSTLADTWADRVRQRYAVVKRSFTFNGDTYWTEWNCKKKAIMAQLHNVKVS
jgi:hypothetical protein